MGNRIDGNAKRRKLRRERKERKGNHGEEFFLRSPILLESNWTFVNHSKRCRNRLNLSQINFLKQYARIINMLT